jgi:hypothetical protein
MSDDPSAMLKILFAIPQGRIDRDLAAAAQDPLGCLKGALNRDNKEPQFMAEFHHQQMVQAKVIRLLDYLPEAYMLFYAAMAAEEIAEEAVGFAHDKGRLGELGRQMDEIRERGGFGEDHYRALGEGPADYRTLTLESDRLYDSVHGTVFTTLLRRYHLNNLAELYENDRSRYDDLREEGRKMVFEKK